MRPRDCGGLCRALQDLGAPPAAPPLSPGVDYSVWADPWTSIAILFLLLLVIVAAYRGARSMHDCDARQRLNR